MARKLTYEELEQRVKELEKESLEHKDVEEALPGSEERYRLLFEQSPIGVGLASPDGKVISANKAMEAITGYSIEELKEINLADIYENPEDRKALLEAVNRDGGVVNFPVRLKRKDGTPYDALLTLSRVHRPGGEDLFQTICVDITKQKQAERALKRAHDELECRVEERTAELRKTNKELQAQITERKQAEQALEEERNLLRTIIDNLPDYIYVKDTQSRYVVTNNAHARFFGATRPEEVIGKTAFEFFPQELASQYYADDQEVIRAGQPLLNREERSVDEAGNRIWNLTSKVPLRDSSGKIVGLVGISRDITARKQAEETLRESEERFREMADLLPTIIGELDLDTRLTYTNRAGFETFGYSQADLEAGLNVVNMIHPDDREKALKNMKRLIEGKKVDANEYRMFRKDGSELTVLIHSSPVYKSGKTIGIRSSLTDITKIKRIEKALRESEETYRTLFENANDAIFIADPDTHIILDANREAEQLIGRPREEIIGMHQSELHPPHDAELYREKFRNHVEKGSVFDLEAEVITKDGAIVAVFISSSVITIHGRELIQGLFTDISKEKMIIDLREKIAAMKLIEKAKGVLMDLHNITEKEAIRRLQQESRRQRKKTKEIAQCVVSSDLILD